MEPKGIEMAALGRALYPGMLYDCRSDSFIPGVTLWDKASLTQDLDVRRKPVTDLKFCASENLSEKASLLDVRASLKASFLGGLVEVGGSAKYLRDEKKSACQSRVIMLYSQTTRFEHLTMTQLGKITYPKVFEENTATHVVTAVLYGAQAVMVFDETVTEKEDKQEVEGNLNLMVEKIPSLSTEGEVTLKMNGKEKKLAEKIRCTFYGDCVLEENPTTYLEAVQLYKKLPSLLSQSESAVPVRVWLHPLAGLDNRAAKIKREVSAMLISKVEGVLEELGDAERRCNDLLKTRRVQDFQDVKERLQKFQESFGNYKVLFQKSLCRLLPDIRGREQNEPSDIERAFTDLLLSHDRYLFKANKLKEWLENVQCELDILTAYTRELNDVPVITSSGKLKGILFDPLVDTVVCFSFTSLKYEDPFLSAIAEFLRVDEFEKLSEIPTSRDQDIQAWFHNPEISEKMKENLFLFKSFSEANKDRKKTKFVVTSVSDSTRPGASIQLYRKGKMVDSNFQPVSKPLAPRVEIQDRNLILKLQKPSTGVAVRYRVEYRITQPNDSGADDGGWEFRDTPDTQETFTLTGLQLAKQYRVRYRAVSDVGVSEASDSVLLSFQGKVDVPLGQSWDGTMSSLYNGLRTEIITGQGTSRWSLSTIQTEVTNRFSDIKILGGLKPGMAFYLQGVVHPDADEAVMYLMTGQQESDDVVMDFHFLANFEYSPSDIKHCHYLPRGSAFDIFIVVTTEGYQVFVNGRKGYLEKHRMPVGKVTTLCCSDNIFMNNIGIVPNWSTSTFGKELSSGTSRSKRSNIQSEVTNPVCNPSKPYVGPITGGLRAGMILFFQGVVPSDSDGFAISLKTGPGDVDNVAFHLKPYFSQFQEYSHLRICSVVVCDNFRNGQWNDREVTPEGPFTMGGAFDIIVAINPEEYEVIVNGHLFCKIKHRVPLEEVSILNIDGDVFMNTFVIIKVDSVNMKVTTPAHV